ncbi:MAG: hypothetical protein DWP92_10345, partial [Armatimonadetes bacterium]
MTAPDDTPKNASTETAPQRPLWRRILPRLIYLLVFLVVLYLFFPTMVSFFNESHKLASVE